jgi:hypothetical protein
MERNRWLTGTLGRNGRQFFREHYDWPVIERKYLDMFARLAAEGNSGPASAAPRVFEPLPGWFERRRRDLPAAGEVLLALQSGPAVAGASEPARRRA